MFFGKTFMIILYMLTHVLLHQLGQMLDNQMLNVVHNVYCVLRPARLSTLALSNHVNCVNFNSNITQHHDNLGLT
jgi:hypothetical protein